MSQAQESQPASAQNKGGKKLRSEMNLIWVDLEMTGLDPETDRIIEVAVVVTDANLNVLAEGPVYAIHQSDAVLNGMDAWNKGTHGRSGLIDRVKASNITEAMAEDALIDFLIDYVPGENRPCAETRFVRIGDSWQKRCRDWKRFSIIAIVDVSTLKELARRWKPELIDGFKKQQKHTALADIMESIDELKYYREHFIKV